jgi:hypothetical protein
VRQVRSYEQISQYPKLRGTKMYSRGAQRAGEKAVATTTRVAMKDTCIVCHRIEVNEFA